jgi:hypothetical protein
LSYDIDLGIIATKIVPKFKFNKKEIDMGIDIWKYGKPCIFVLKTVGYHAFGDFPILQTEYCNCEVCKLFIFHLNIDFLYLSP